MHVKIDDPIATDVLSIDPDKLDLLADWFDANDARQEGKRGVTVQADLRRWAKVLRRFRAACDAPSLVTPTGVTDGNWHCPHCEYDNAMVVIGPDNVVVLRCHRCNRDDPVRS